MVVVLGTAALAAVPPSAGQPTGPTAITPAPPPDTTSALAGLLTAATPLTPAERALRDPAAESLRINAVAFRLAAVPATPAAPDAAAASTVPDLPRITTTAKPGTAAAAAIEFALAQRGLPYVWGGNGPQQGHAGFDCSGLTTAAYDYAGIDLPRTAHTQYYAGPHVPADAELEPGDLVFYGVPQRVHHVGLYIGDGRMVAAPTFGKPVRLSYVRYNGDDYLGATRPAADRDAGPLDAGLLATPDLPVEVPAVPAPEVPPAPEEFAAPEVPAEDIPADEIPTEEIPADEIPTPESPTSDPTVATAPPETGTPPTALTLPDGTELALTGAERDDDGLPAAPADPTAGGMRFSPAEDDRGARTTVRLHPDTAAGALEPGAVLVLRTADGTTVELTVRSRDTVHPDTAADLASGRGGTTRVVLLLDDPDSDEVLVLIAD